MQVSDKRIRVSSPQIERAYESSPHVAIEDTQGQKKIIAFGGEAEGQRGRSNVVVVNPFSHPRLIVGDFTVAEKLLQHAVRTLLKGTWFRPITLGIIHPEREMEGGLTQIEYRALNDLCVVAGCRATAVYEGRPLTPAEINGHKQRT